MPYIPHTDADRTAMLEAIGVSSMDDLFLEIPEQLRIKPGSLNLPSAMSEPRLVDHFSALSKKNVNLRDVVCFLGAGIYDRFIPSSVGAVISRGEYLTAYTPYQPEESQGMLQTIYEFQSMVAELFGVDIANASMYDAATAMAEAAILAYGVNGRQKICVSEAIHPHFRQVLDSYCWSSGLEVSTLPTNKGQTRDYSSLDVDAACVIVGYPNFFGQIEDLVAARAACDSTGALLIVVADPVACALLKPPGHFGADIVVGEGQSLGVGMGLGGPLVGLFGCKEEFVRRVPGRIVGRTTEAHGPNSGFTMTLRTREQDIRREKATSNICTNEALMALANTVYLSALGKNGLQQVAAGTVQNTQYALAKLKEAGAKPAFSGRVFGEFVVRLPKDPSDICAKLLEKGILAGLPLAPYYRDLQDGLLVAVTEVRTKAQIDAYASALGGLL